MLHPFFPFLSRYEDNPAPKEAEDSQDKTTKPAEAKKTKWELSLQNLSSTWIMDCPNRWLYFHQNLFKSNTIANTCNTMIKNSLCISFAWMHIHRLVVFTLMHNDCILENPCTLKAMWHTAHSRMKTERVNIVKTRLLCVL